MFVIFKNEVLIAISTNEKKACQLFVDKQADKIIKIAASKEIENHLFIEGQLGLIDDVNCEPVETCKTIEQIDQFITTIDEKLCKFIEQAKNIDLKDKFETIRIKVSNALKELNKSKEELNDKDKK